MAPISFGAGAHDDVVRQRGMSLLSFGAGAAQCHALVEMTIVADLRRLADDDAHAVIDEQPFADLGAGVDLDPR